MEIVPLDLVFEFQNPNFSGLIEFFRRFTFGRFFFGGLILLEGLLCYAYDFILIF